MTGQLHAPDRSTPGTTAHAASSIGPTVGQDVVEEKNCAYRDQTMIPLVIQPEI